MTVLDDDTAPVTDLSGAEDHGPGGEGSSLSDDAASGAAFVCADCGMVAQTQRGLTRHINSAHRDSPGVGETGAPGEDSTETQPGVPPKKRRTFRQLLSGTKGDGTKKPKRTWTMRGPREPLDEFVGWAYGGVGSMIVRAGSDMTPVGKVMEMQAPSIGIMADEAIKGTPADKIIQVFVRQGKAFKEIGETVALPAMTGMIVKKPALLGLRWVSVPNELTGEMERRLIADGPFFQPYYSLWETCAVQMAQGFERKELKRRELAKELEAIPFLQPIIAQGMDPILYMMVETLGAPADEPIDVQPVP